MPTIHVPAQEIPVVAETEVLVVGGGAAGLAAATAAARNGAQTMLSERYGYLGGLATGGLIILLLTLDDGRGNPVIAGLCQEFVDRLARRDALFYPPPADWGRQDERLIERYRHWGLVWGHGPHAVRYSVAYDPEHFKFVADELLAEAGVRLRYHTWGAQAVVADGRVEAVVFQSKAGREAIRAQVVIDATGDGDIFASAGAGFELERVHPHLWFRMANVRDVPRALAAAPYRFFQMINGGQVLVAWGIGGREDRQIDPTDPGDLTEAELTMRRLAWQQAERLRAEVPGFERAFVSDLAPQLGITESRRLVGELVLTHDAALTPLPDTVARTGHWTRYGIVYHIPLRSLLPPGLDNLLAAGRCIAVEHRVHNATKEIPACFATGEAAGTAAALAVKQNRAVRALDVAQLRARLVEQGASL